MSYQCFYGFQTEIARLYRSSLIWQQIRTLRLSHLRLSSRNSEGTRLSSLPQELITLIEDHLLESQTPFASLSWPVSGECECEENELIREFEGRDKTNKNFVDWCAEHHSVDIEGDELDDPIRRKALWGQFAPSETYDSTLYHFFTVHEETCPDIESYYAFWHNVVAYDSREEYEALEEGSFDKTEEAISAVEMILTFLREHGFQRTPAEDGSDLDEESLVGLAFSTTMVHTDSRPEKRELSHATRNHIKAFSQRFRLDRPFGRVNSRRRRIAANIRYLAADCANGGVYEERQMPELFDEDTSDCADQLSVSEEDWDTSAEASTDSDSEEDTGTD